jgi:hypothetical protein
MLSMTALATNFMVAGSVGGVDRLQQAGRVHPEPGC